MNRAQEFRTAMAARRRKSFTAHLQAIGASGRAKAGVVELNEDNGRVAIRFVDGSTARQGEPSLPPQTPRAA